MNTGSYFLMDGNVLDVLPLLEPNSFDSCFCDPPYGLKFMGKSWDHGVPSVEIWREVFRVLKPGAFLMAFGGTRTYHRLTCAIEDAGFEIRDCLMWLYGQGFPKSLDISKAIDKELGNEREVLGEGKGRTGKSSKPNAGSLFSDDGYNWPGNFEITAPGSSCSELFEGYGTAIKPAWEPIILAMKPCEGTFAQNALTHGVEALLVSSTQLKSQPPNVISVTSIVAILPSNQFPFAHISQPFFSLHLVILTLVAYSSRSPARGQK